MSGKVKSPTGDLCSWSWPLGASDQWSITRGVPNGTSGLDPASESQHVSAHSLCLPCRPVLRVMDSSRWP